MKNLNVDPFDKEELIKGLEIGFPYYKIQTGFGGLQVRTSGFTVTGNVKIKVNPKQGKITVQTNYDMVIIFLLFALPLGLYIFIKKEKQQALEREVVAEIENILNVKPS